MAIAENGELARDLQQLIDRHIDNAWTIQTAPQAPALRLIAIQMLMPILEHQL
jgi:hypothetical protein